MFVRLEEFVAVFPLRPRVCACGVQAAKFVDLIPVSDDNQAISFECMAANVGITEAR